MCVYNLPPILMRSMWHSCVNTLCVCSVHWSTLLEVWTDMDNFSWWHNSKSKSRATFEGCALGNYLELYMYFCQSQEKRKEKKKKLQIWYPCISVPHKQIACAILSGWQIFEVVLISTCARQKFYVGQPKGPISNKSAAWNLRSGIRRETVTYYR